MEAGRSRHQSPREQGERERDKHLFPMLHFYHKHMQTVGRDRGA